MVQLLQAVDLSRMSDKSSVFSIKILENYDACPAMHQSHRTHEARLNISDYNHVFEEVRVVFLPLTSSYSFVTGFSCKHHDRMVNDTPRGISQFTRL